MVPHVNRLDQVIENDIAAGLHFMHAPDLDGAGGRLGRLRRAGNGRADLTTMNDVPTDRIARMELVAEEVFLWLGNVVYLPLVVRTDVRPLNKAAPSSS